MTDEVSIGDKRDVDMEKGDAEDDVASKEEAPLQDDEPKKRYGWLHCCCHTSIVLVFGCPAYWTVVAIVCTLVGTLWYPPLLLMLSVYGLVGPFVHGCWLGSTSTEFDRSVLSAFRLIPDFLQNDGACLCFLSLLGAIAALVDLINLDLIEERLPDDTISRGVVPNIALFVVYTLMCVGFFVLLMVNVMVAFWASLLLLRKLYLTGHKFAQLRMEKVPAGSSPPERGLLLLFVLIRAFLITGMVLYLVFDYNRHQDSRIELVSYGYLIQVAIQCSGFAFALAHLWTLTTITSRPLNESL